MTVKEGERHMARVLAVATHATDDPTKSTLAFVTVVSAVRAGKDAGLVLVGEGVYLAKQPVAASVPGVGFPPLSEFIETAVQNKIPVYV